MSYQNLTSGLSNITSISDVLTFANTSTSGTFWNGMFLLLVFVIFLSTAGLGFEISMMMAFFGGLIIGVFMLYLGIISLYLVGVVEAVLLFTVVYLIYTSRSNQ